MLCRYCLRPIEATIEGNEICVSCFCEEDKLPDQEAIAWLKSHCMDCGVPVRGGGYCPDCHAENEGALAITLQEHQGSTAFVHWRGPGWYVPILGIDGDLFYYHAMHNPHGNDNPADGWPTINVQTWADFDASLSEHGTFVACMTGMEREDYGSRGDL